MTNYARKSHIFIINKKKSKYYPLNQLNKKPNKQLSFKENKHSNSFFEFLLEPCIEKPQKISLKKKL